MDRPVRERPDHVEFRKDMAEKGVSGIYTDPSGKRHFGVVNEFDGDAREFRWLCKHLSLDDEVLAQLPIPGHFSTRGRMLERLLKIVKMKPGLLLLALIFSGCVDLIAPDPDPRILDPCYSATVWMTVDTLTHEIVQDSVSWEWTPGECSE